MALPDSNYLKTQYQNKVLKKNAALYQAFFEDCMLALHPGKFEKVRPDLPGDKGNDGFLKEEGTYYQVYAPEDPDDKLPTAIRKMKTNFKTLYEYWNGIYPEYPIKKFYFVYNDKYYGKGPDFHKALGEIGEEYPDIKFDVLTPDQMEDDVTSLPEADLIKLGFNVDSRTIVKFLEEGFNAIENAIDRGAYDLAKKLLESLQPLVKKEDSNQINLEYNLLEVRIEEKLNKAPENIEQKYQALCNMYSRDPRPFLYIAEFYLNNGNFEKNVEMLNKAESIDPDHWLLKVEKLAKAVKCGEQIDLESVDEKSFPSNNDRAKSIFYRLYAVHFANAKNLSKAKEFIDKAIYYNGERLHNYTVKVEIGVSGLMGRNFDDIASEECEAILKDCSIALAKIHELESTHKESRIPILLNQIKPLIFLNRYEDASEAVSQAFNLILECKFKPVIELYLSEVLQFEMPISDFEKLLNYLESEEAHLSDTFIPSLVHQFLKQKNLPRGKNFFIKKGNIKGQKLIEAIEADDSEGVLKMIGDDLFYMLEFSGALKDHQKISKAILDALPEKDGVEKDKLMLRYYYENNELDKAFEILMRLNLSKLIYSECEIFSQLAHDKKAWDIELKILEQSLSLEENLKKATQIRLAIFTANFNLKRYDEVSRLGTELLNDKDSIIHVKPSNQEVLLNQTLGALLEYNKDDDAFKLLNEHINLAKSFVFKAGIEAEIYIRKKEYDKALKAIVAGAESKSHLSEEEYFKLFYPLVIQIGNEKADLLNFEDTISDGSFVKLTDQSKWYFIGEGNPLDTYHVAKDDPKYEALKGKKLGDLIEFPGDEFMTVSRKIECILPISGYLTWRAREAFYTLCQAEPGKYGYVIETSEKNGQVDLSNMTKFLQKNAAGRSDFFEMYCAKNLPLALLAINEGGLTRAIGKIGQEDRGFIRLSSGVREQDQKQIQVAEAIIKGDNEAWLDGTAALFLAESGFLEKVLSKVKTLKVPQSVINFLYKVHDKFKITPGSAGTLGFARGRIIANQLSEEISKKVQENFSKAINFLEINKQNIIPISEALKIDCFSEFSVPSELCDACILAQREGGIVITDDYLYLQANTLETKKAEPNHTSSYAIVKYLYQKNILPFETYLDYFDYLARYRGRFLSLSGEELMKSIIEKRGKLTKINPENIRKFRLERTLSQEYGVSLENAVMVMVDFLSRVMRDISITPETADKVFTESIPRFLNAWKSRKKFVGEMLIRVCKIHMENLNKKEPILVLSKIKTEKFKRFVYYVNLYSEDSLL